MTNKEIKNALLIPGTQFTVDRITTSRGGKTIFEMSRYTEDRMRPGDGMSVNNKSLYYSSANVEKTTASVISFYMYSPFGTRLIDKIKFSEIKIVRVGKADPILTDITA
jgi:hypothetical protein